MVIVAVAGGTGHLGRTIVEAIIATGKHEVKVLSRTVSLLSILSELEVCPNANQTNPKLERMLGVPVIPIDYLDVDGLTKKLEDLGIHTVVSALSNYDDAKGNCPPELELIRAADASPVTKRMVTSRWSAPYSDRYTPKFTSSLLPQANSLCIIGTLARSAPWPTYKMPRRYCRRPAIWSTQLSTAAISWTTGACRSSHLTCRPSQWCWTSPTTVQSFLGPAMFL